MSAANTLGCIEELIGEKLIGIIEHWSQSDITRCKALVFDSGRALILADNGSFWTERAEEVHRKIEALKDEHRREKKRIEGLLALAGVTEGTR